MSKAIETIAHKLVTARYNNKFIPKISKTLIQNPKTPVVIQEMYRF